MTPDQNKLAEAVAAQLGLPAATGFEGHWSRVFALPDGGRLYIHSGRQRGQLHISASVAPTLREHRPCYRDGEAPRTAINVSESKGAQRIAADVRRRLLPEYEREASACKACKARHDDFNARRILALTQVAAPFGERIQHDDSGEPRPLTIERDGKFNLIAKPFCESLRLEIEVSPQIAGRIAALLASL
jgi:hypothetical protein